jgi:TonB family protein
MKPLNLLALFVVSLCIVPRSDAAPNSLRGRSSNPQTAAASQYADTTESFYRFLHDILDATKNGDKQRVSYLMKSTEIPNCDAWLHQMYKSDSADSWMGLCDPKILATKEKSMEEQFAALTHEQGDFSVRKVNDNPEGGPGGYEAGMVVGAKVPLEVYFAWWKAAKEPELRGNALGYFYFLDGSFRWDSGTIAFPKIKISTAKIVHAQLIKKVDPVYPPDASAQHITGTVRVYYVIGGDGKVYNAHALSGEGLSEDPSLRKAAEEAVLQWIYQPATMDGKPIEMGGVTADVKFQ